MSHPAMTLDVTPPEIFGYIHRTYGPEGLRHTIREIVTARSSRMCQELFMGWAGELRDLGLISVAEIMEAEASTMPHVWQLPCPCPTESVNLVKEWKQDMETKKREWENHIA